jgi:hypothetical protein
MKILSILSVLLKQKQIDVIDAKETMEFYNTTATVTTDLTEPDRSVTHVGDPCELF